MTDCLPHTISESTESDTKWSKVFFAQAELVFLGQSLMKPPCCSVICRLLFLFSRMQVRLSLMRIPEFSEPIGRSNSARNIDSQTKRETKIGQKYQEEWNP